MRTVLIYDLRTEGHHIEYLHHLYLGALKHPENRYVFAVGSDFKDRSTDFQWDKSDNVSFHFYENKEGNGNVIAKAWRMSQQLKSVAKETKPDRIFLSTLMNFMPFLPFVVGKSRVSGIIYSIYLHELERMSFVGKILNKLKYNILSNNKHIEDIFILNDSASVSKLNEIWETDKFRFLTDPYIPFNDEDICDVRAELGVEDGRSMILHLGSLEMRKGTLDVLDMIKRTPAIDGNKYCVVFAGRLDNEIKDSFYKTINELNTSVQVILKIGFLPYSMMGSLVKTADKVLLPYRMVSASSGIIGYCAQFKTPVYVPAKGLIGKLVEEYKIGLCLDKFNNINDLRDVVIDDCNYCESHTVDDFIDDIYSKIS